MQRFGRLSSNGKLAMQIRVLWLSVIKQAMDDYKALNYKYFKPHNKLSKAYFFSDDFKEICALAEIEPQSIREVLGIEI